MSDRASDREDETPKEPYVVRERMTKMGSKIDVQLRLSLTREQAQKLVDELWDYGIHPACVTKCVQDCDRIEADVIKLLDAARPFGPKGKDS